MAIALSSSIDFRKDDRTRYLDENNVVDITKDSLKSLKLKVDGETDLDSHIASINEKVEKWFDGTLLNEREKTITLTVNGAQITDTMKNIVMSGQKDKLDALAQYVVATSGYLEEVNKIEDNEIKTALKTYKFELKDLWKQIQASAEGPEGSAGNSNVILSNKGEGTNDKESVQIDTFYIDPFANREYAAIGKDDNIENIYNDRKLRTAMERIFDNEQKEELHKRTFSINLGIESGLAGILIAIRKASQFKKDHEKERDDMTEDDPNYKYKQIVEAFPIDDENPQAPLCSNQQIAKKSLNTLIKKGIFTYKRDGGVDSEIGKIAKIFSNAQRKDLDTFTALVESKSDVEMAVKGWNNALEMTGNSRANKERKQNKNYKEKSSKVNPGNVLSFLCDLNGDGAIAINGKENQGDVGTVFGQQLLFTLEQAIGVKEVEFGKEKANNIVIRNILKNMKMRDSRSLSKEQTKFFDAMVNDETKCTKENLSKLIVGYKDSDGNSVDGMPEFKSLFLDAITTINGGSTEVQPDLYETLVGDDAKSIIETKETKTEARVAIDTWLKEVKKLDDPEQAALRQLIKEQGVVRVRETIFIKLMTVLDNATITTNNGARTQIQAAGITKGRAARNAQKEFLETTVNKLINGGIHYSAQGGLRLTLGLGENGTSLSGRTKRSRSGEAGIIVGPQGVELFVGVAGEIAEQYNHGTVINADLSQVRSAKYLGLEGQAVAAIGITNGLGVEVSGAINWKKDYIVGINQINEQYTSLSQELFTIEDMSEETLIDKKLFQAHIENKITQFSGGKYAKFVEKNMQHLLKNAENIVNYMDANKFFGPTGRIALLPEERNKTEAIQTLVDIMQSGNIETRRHDVISGLHGKIDITKLSFGVTSNILSFKLPKSTKHAPTASGTAGETTEPGNIPTGGTESEVDLGQERFGIFGFYVGARLSTWKNKYVPNEQQYLYTQYEMGQGIGAEHIETKDGNLQKYANYLTALYNVSPKGKLTCTIKEGKLVIKLNTKSDYPKLQDFLNIHATAEAEKSFSLKNNTLTIGNVGEIGAYTVTEAKGVSRVLCLGSKQIDVAHRISQDTEAMVLPPIKKEINGKKEWPKEKIETKIIPTMKGADTKEAPETIKKETATFFDKEGKLVSPEGTTTTFVGCSEGQKFTTGTLTIIKTADNTYTIKLDSTTSTEKFTLTYRDQKEYDAAVKVAQENPANYTTIKDTITNLFVPEKESELATVQSLLNILTNSIKDIEKTNKSTNSEYLKFLTAASNILDNDGEINDKEITDALGYLKTLLPNNTTQLTTLHNYFDSNDWSTKSYIVDRLKQIFAKDAWYTGKKLSTILQIHNYGNSREKLTGPSGESLPKALKKEIKAQRAIRAKSTDTYNENPKIHQNLLGYTGFYRYAAGEQYKNQKFSMTSLGNTSSQVEPYDITENAEAATTWFLNNLEKNTYEVTALAKQLEKQIKARGATVSLVKENSQDTFATIKKLLQGETITLDSGTKISINSKAVFYLLGECANESLGLEITDITITTLKNNLPIAGEYTGNGSPENNYVMGIDVWGKSHSIANHVTSKELNAGLNHHRSKNTPPTAGGAAGSASGSDTNQVGDISSGGGEIE